LYFAERIAITMKKQNLLVFFLILSFNLQAQNVCTPEFLWGLGRVSGQAISEDGRTLYYSVSQTDVNTQKRSRKSYAIPVSGGQANEIDQIPGPEKPRAEGASMMKVSKDGRRAIFAREVKIDKMLGSDLYPSYQNSEVYIYNDLNQRHWDTWEDGKYNHLFVGDVGYGVVSNEKDLFPNKAWECPVKPFGGSEDFIFTPDGDQVIYVTKQSEGVGYAQSTNTDLFLYDIPTSATTNITFRNKGYDNNPAFSPKGNKLAYTQMIRDGYEADKNDIILMNWPSQRKVNLTEGWDESVSGFKWSNDGSTIYFTAAQGGTKQLFSIAIDGAKIVRRVTEGQWDIRGIVGDTRDEIIVHRGDMNQATEIYGVNKKNGLMRQITHVNDQAYASIKKPRIESRITKISGKDDLFSWVIYPPNFDPNKKYPTLLYCQGGPQGALSQFYSYRWNFQLMASQGYIVIAPNRTGMPGWGTEWNEQISGDWGGLAMEHYLAAIDDISSESYVDRERLGAVGASYGGYSVFMLAGIHEGRFKSFISHCGLFDLNSWYGTTEELFFANWDIGGPYWDKTNKKAQRSYDKSNPSNHVDDWDTPILIFQGGKDYRVPQGQGLQAFQAARIKGIKSRFVYLPNENHWVLNPQNAMIWQKEFYRWLKETL